VSGFLLVNQGQTIAIVGPLVADIDADVIVLRDLPLEKMVYLLVCFGGF
jgi:hypothetical protein